MNRDVTADQAAGANMIMQAALAAFVKHGFHGTSIREIASHAKVSVALIYYHFTSKDDILRSIMLRVHGDAIEELRAVRDACTGGVREELSSLIRTHVLYHCERQAESFIGSSELRSLSGCAREEVIGQRDAVAGFFKDVVVRGVADGTFRTREQPDDVVRAIMVLSMGVAMWFREDGPQTADQVVQTHIGFAMRLLEAEPTA